MKSIRTVLTTNVRINTQNMNVVKQRIVKIIIIDCQVTILAMKYIRIYTVASIFASHFTKSDSRVQNQLRAI